MLKFEDTRKIESCRNLELIRQSGHLV